MAAPLAVKVTAGAAGHFVAGGHVMTGIGFTVTVTVPVLTQPAALVPVMVYVVVAVGLAVTLVPVVALKPVAGDHV